MIIASLSLLLAASAAPAQAGTCPLGVVSGGSGVPKAEVHRAPVLSAQKVARLGSGSALFVCGERNGWYWVHYHTSGKRCLGTRAGLDVRYASTCATGWMPKYRVALMSR